MALYPLILSKLKYTLYISLFCVVVISCECSTRKGEKSKSIQTPEQQQYDPIEVQRDFLKKERASIEAYIKDRDLELQRTGSGMYYTILEDSSAAEVVESEDIVEFEYDVYMLNGSLLFSSSESGNRILKIDKQDAEIGLHESLKKLGLGDKGLFILPSHLAFGVAGDQYKVPPKTALVYELKIVNIQKSKS